MSKYLAKFINVGRSHANWEQGYKDMPTQNALLRAIMKQKVLMSRCVEVVPVRESESTLFCSIHAGFHKVGTVEVVEVGDEPQMQDVLL